MAGVRCKWSWSWLKLEAALDIKGAEYIFPLSDFLKKKKKKVDTPGRAKCILCVKAINYGSKGSHAILAHCQTDRHKQRVNILSSRSISVIQVPVSETPTAAAAKETPASENIPMLLADRVKNAEVGVVV